MRTLAHAAEAPELSFGDQSVLVIDVFRATSCMVTGLVYGAAGILPVLTLEEAKALAGPRDLLAGERKGCKPPEFQLGNSPLEFMSPDVCGRRIVMSTSNGTRAMNRAQGSAHSVMACALLNAPAAANAVWASGRDVTLLCSGTENRFSLEDGLCAGMVADELMRLSHGILSMCDFTLAMLACYSQCKNSLVQALADSANGRRLIRMGCGRDVAFCSSADLYQLVPVLQNGLLVPLEGCLPYNGSPLF